MLVPREAFINSYAQLFQKLFMIEPADQGNKHQKVLINYLERSCQNRKSTFVSILSLLEICWIIC